jgi:integrase
LHPQLLAIIEATPSNQLTFIVTEHGKTFANAQKFGNHMRQWAREAGPTGCPLYGLRKACCRRLAEAGCSEKEIASVSGHKSPSEVARYTKDASEAYG